MPKFVIGIGSQRAGSTLLHRILDECTDIFMHPVKELHYYDTLYGVRNASVLKEYSKRQIDRELDRLIDAKAYSYINKKYKCYIRANKILASQDIKEVDYLDLYRPCVMGNDTVGEITPEYMILPEEAVAKMSEQLGSDTKIILLSRDPIERFISAYKLLKVYNGGMYDREIFVEDVEQINKNMPGWIEQQIGFNDYTSAFYKYSSYFKDVFWVKYEEIIIHPCEFLKKLKDFIGADLNEEKALELMSKRVNSIAESGEITHEMRNVVLGILNKDGKE